MVNIYKVKLTNLQQRILRLLFIMMGTSLNAHTIAGKVGASQPAVSKALPFLIQDSLIKVDKDKNSGRLSIELNRNNHRVLQLKRADNLKLIYETGLVDILEREFAGTTIILFGSYSRGDDTIRSDIDIAIIGRKDRLLALNKFESLLRRKISLNFYESWTKIHKNLKENICNGIVLFPVQYLR